MAYSRRLIPSTRGPLRRALILTLYIAILAAAVTLQAYQNRSDKVAIYVEGNVAYARVMSESSAHALFPLPDECGLVWARQGESWHIPAGLAAFSGLTALRFPTMGDVTVSQGSPWVTIQSKAGSIQVRANCPPPAPTTHHMYIYAQNNYLFAYDTLNGHTRLLMPLSELLLWAGDETWIFALDLLVVRAEDLKGYDWLSPDAIVLGDFETGSNIVVNNLADKQVQILYGDHELSLVSYERE